MMFCPDEKAWGDIAAWVAIGVAIATAYFAVRGAFYLWRRQQVARGTQLRRLSIAIFQEVYHRFLEIEALSDFEKWRAFASRANGGAEIASTPDMWRLHKELFLNSLEAQRVVMHVSATNLDSVRQNLLDADDVSVEAFLRLHGLVGGAPTQIDRVMSSWRDATVRPDGPARLPANLQQLIAIGVSACAFHLNQLDGGNRPRADEYAPTYRAQRDLHAGLI